MTKLKNMFFEYNYINTKEDDSSFKIGNDSTVVSELDCYAVKYAQKAVSKCFDNGKKIVVKLSLGVSDDLKSQIGDAYIECDEAYVIDIKSDSINICSSGTRGLIYGVSTLKQLIDSDNIKEMLLFDAPDKAVRGYRVYLPGKESLDAFEAMIDTLVYYKYNSVIMEVGGAMEYKRHPEINEKWVEFCTHVNSIPGEANRIQRETPQMQYAKDSIHSENGGGSYISQDDVRRIVKYCKEREITIIPEVPSLSHSDYIVMAHPDLNERVYDQYPDTYCPSNPKSYEIVFDIIDEVVDVFQPEYLNIGHDEVYTIALCDKCTGKDPVELFVGDIVKINDYLHTKGVRAMMWCDKLLHAYVDGIPVGGSYREEFGIPEMYPSREKLPNDIILLNWYWSLCDPDDQKYLTDSLGFEMVYGNYVAIEHQNYREVSQSVKGAFCSNWGYSEEEYMQRNQQNYALVTTAYVLWSNTYTIDNMAELLANTETELHSRYINNFVSDDYIEIIHTTDTQRQDGYFWCGNYIYDEDWILGHYRVTYSDGSDILLQVRYGFNIANCNLEKGSEDYSRLLGASKPIVIDGKLYYKAVYTNPYPDKKIVNIVYEAAGEDEIEFLPDKVKLVSKTAM